MIFPSTVQLLHSKSNTSKTDTGGLVSCPQWMRLEHQHGLNCDPSTIFFVLKEKGAAL